jgi:hypothetical protein
VTELKQTPQIPKSREEREKLFTKEVQDLEKLATQLQKLPDWELDWMEEQIAFIKAFRAMEEIKKDGYMVFVEELEPEE